MDPLRISLVGLSQWESVFVQTTVDLASGIDIASWRLVNDPESADVLLVDADRRGAATAGDSDRKDRPIVVSFSGEARTPGRGLVRPVSYADLVAMLKEIESELGEPERDNVPTLVPTPETVAVAPTERVAEGLPETVNEAPSEPPAVARSEPVAAPTHERGPAPTPVQRSVPTTLPTLVPETESATSTDTTSALKSPLSRSKESLADKARPAKRFVEATRLIGLLKQVVAAGLPVDIAHADYPSMLVFPKYSAYSTLAESLAIPRLFRCSALEFELGPVPEDVAADALASDRCRPLSRLVYCASLFGSEGRLLLNVDPADKLRLTNWPDFDAVPYLPEHKAIAKFMLVHTATLDEIAVATGVGIDAIIDFCNACEAAGLIERRSSSGILRAPGALLDRMRGFFGT